MYIYIDESGDLGTKKGSSNYFVINAIAVNDSKKLEKIINKTKHSTKKHLKSNNEIKSSNLPNEIKKNILKKLNNIEYKTFSIIFNKNYRYKIGYEYTNNETYDIIASELAKLININSPTFIFIDKSKNKKEEILNFNTKFEENLINIKKYPIKIEHVNSRNYKGLQIADLISWSVFQSVEHENNEFLDLIKNKSMKRIYED